MSLLLDTHIFLWLVTGDPRLKQSIRELLETTERLYLSIASTWELAIKFRLGKLSFDEPFEDYLKSQLSLNRIELLPVSLNHTIAVAHLPLHHRDPFDRMLVVQSIMENIRNVSADPLFDQFEGLHRIW